MSFCVITHPIGQNGRAVCKKHCGNHGAGDARGAKRRALSAAGRPAIDREYEFDRVLEYVRVQPGGRPALGLGCSIASYSLASLALISRSCAGTSIDAGLSGGVRTSSLYSQAGPTKVSDFSHIYASCKARLKRRVNCSLSYRYYSIHAGVELSLRLGSLNSTCSEGCGLQIRLYAHAHTF